MKPETIRTLRLYWRTLRKFSGPGSLLDDYRILRNLSRIFHLSGPAA